MILYPSSARKWKTGKGGLRCERAIERVSLDSLSQLQGTALPIPFSDMSPNAQENIKAICRAFEISINGVPSNGWELWKEDLDDLDDWEKAILDIKHSRAQLEDPRGSRTPAVPPVSRKDSTQRVSVEHRDMQVELNGSLNTKESKGTKILEAKSHGGSASHSPMRSTEEGLNAVEKKSVEQIRNWALLSPHTDPPQNAIEVVLRSVETSRILRLIVPNDSNPLIRAAVISSFTEKIGASVARVMMAETIVPYLQTLKAPAPREVMTAVVKFCSFHWRAAVAMYTHFGDSDKLVNGAVAELLGRVAGELTSEVALSCLKEYSKCTWGEDGIKVIEALMTKSRDQPGVVSTIIPSLEKNVIGMEKSVRFGKLLFTTVKDFPIVENEFEQVLESVAARSKVFLAKRALSHLKSKR